VHSSDTEQVVDGKRFTHLGPNLDEGLGSRLPEGPEPPVDDAVLPIDPDQEAAPRPFDPSRRRTGSVPPWRVLAAIALGAYAGGLARYGLGLAFPTAHGAFPAATFAINVSGSFILALLVVFVLEVWPPTTYIRPLIGTGFCGAYTTFSTWMVGTDQLVAGHHTATALWYLAASLIAGLAATSLGLTSGRAVVAHRRRIHNAADAAEEVGA
jgi:CrcB protein